MKVELNNVVKRFTGRRGQPVTVLDGISLSCPAGGATILKGRSGSGKSTLLNLIAGLFAPDSGWILVGETRLDGLTESRRDRFRAANVGYVFQTFNLLSPLTAVENLVIPAALAGYAGSGSEARAREILTELGLGAELDKHPYELSVGQRQRVAVARAVLKQPAILLADEPTANLDEQSAAAVIAAIGDLVAKGATLIVATHDPLLVQAFDGAAVFDVETGEAVR
jgi:putative ABC transport system ATP-binding protein